MGHGGVGALKKSCAGPEQHAHIVEIWGAEVQKPLSCMILVARWHTTVKTPYFCPVRACAR